MLKFLNLVAAIFLSTSMYAVAFFHHSGKKIHGFASLIKPNKEPLPFKVNVINTAVINGLPWLQLHHVVLLTFPDSEKALAVDFTPVAAGDSSTVSDLLSNKNVDGEIRVNIIKKSSIKTMKNEWVNLITESTKSGCFSNIILKGDIRKNNCIHKELANESIEGVALKLLEIIQRDWSSSMNFYKHNCQHFSFYVQKNLLSSYRRASL